MNNNFSSVDHLLDFPVEILFQIFGRLSDRFGLLRCVSNDVKRIIDSMLIDQRFTTNASIIFESSSLADFYAHKGLYIPTEICTDHRKLIWLKSNNGFFSNFCPPFGSWLLTSYLTCNIIMTMIQTKQNALLRFIFDVSNKSHQFALDKIFAFFLPLCIKFDNSKDYFLIHDWKRSDPNKTACLVQLGATHSIRVLSNLSVPMATIKSATFEPNCIKIWDGLVMYENRFSKSGACFAKKMLKIGERCINMD